MTPSHVVVIPIKSFTTAKARLSPTIDATTRADLARQMSHHVLSQLTGLDVAVVGSDPEVQELAHRFGADILLDNGGGLNVALTSAVSTLRERGVSRVTIVHADLPNATPLRPILESARLQPREVFVIPDRHLDGTNVLSIPTGVEFALQYGARSFGLHLNEALRHRLRTVVVRDRGFGHDIDIPTDLSP